MKGPVRSESLRTAPISPGPQKRGLCLTSVKYSCRSQERLSLASHDPCPGPYPGPAPGSFPITYWGGSQGPGKMLQQPMGPGSGEGQLPLPRSSPAPPAQKHCPFSVTAKGQLTPQEDPRRVGWCHSPRASSEPLPRVIHHLLPSLKLWLLHLRNKSRPRHLFMLCDLRQVA